MSTALHFWWFWPVITVLAIVALVLWTPKGERAESLAWCASTYVIGTCLWGVAWLFGWWTP